MATSDLLKARQEFRDRRISYLTLFTLWAFFGFILATNIGFLGFVIYGLGFWAIVRGAKQPIRFFCPKCDAYTGSDGDWTCDFCRFHNQRDKYWYSFIYLYSRFDQCKACGKEPRFLQCWKCSELIFFTPDAKEAHEQVTERLAPSAPENPKESYIKEQEAVEHQIMMARLNRELAQLREASAEEPGLSPKKKLRKTFKEKQDEALGLIELVRKAKSDNAKKYKDDPEMLKRANAWVEDFLREHGV